MLGFVLAMLCGGDMFPAQKTASQDPPVLLVSEARHRELLSIMPKTESGKLEAALRNGPIFYNDEVLPPAFQQVSNVNSSFHSPSYNLAGSLDPVGHPNGEHPWKTGLGLDNCNNEIVRFLSLPRGERIQWNWVVPTYVPTLVNSFHSTTNPPGHVRYLQYPVGTTAAEIVLVRSPDGKQYPSIVRLWSKLQEGLWQPSVLTPIRQARELVQLAERQGTPQDKAELRRHYWKEGGLKFPVLNVKIPRIFPGRYGSRQANTYSAMQDELPALSEQLTKAILTRSFVVQDPGVAWLEGKQTDNAFSCYYPTTDADFSFVPKHYAGGYLPPTRKDCSTCHQQALHHASEIQANREWYGYVRGSDNILSFHVEDPSTISYNGTQGASRLRQVFLDAGIIRPQPDPIERKINADPDVGK